MGLDVSYDCWHGAYSAFMRFRIAVASVIGIDLSQMHGFGGSTPWDSLAPDPLHTLLHHSDCDGEIAAEDCLPIAQRLEALIPALVTYDQLQGFGGHLRDGAAGAARRFAEGLKAAHDDRNPVEFF